MQVVGINYTTDSDGNRRTTIHVVDDFDPYYSNADAGRGCAGRRVESIYVGTLDCSQIKVNSHVEIMYDKARSSKDGKFYQPIKDIRLVEK